MEDKLRAKKGVEGDCPHPSQENVQHLSRSIAPPGLRGTAEKTLPQSLWKGSRGHDPGQQMVATLQQAGYTVDLRSASVVWVRHAGRA